MEFTFQLAKNNEQTVLVNNYFLHSSYNPSKEAERIVENLDVPFTPENIIVIEPALSYCAKYLKNKFPASKLYALRICNNFSEYDSLFDKTINYFQHKEAFEAYLSNIFNEEQLLKTYIFSWKSSENVFSEDFKNIYNSLSNALNKAKTLLVTRQYFEKKWLINSIKFIKYAKSFVKISGKINKPVLIVSSGPSLKNYIFTIKENRTKFFIICLSSAVSVCSYYNIIPDLYMTTDGGFWAGQHLKKLNKNIPIAIPTEAFIPSFVYSNNKILPLDYQDSLINEYIKQTDLQTFFAERNGTVTGTALKFALSLNELPVFLCGVDMSSGKGYQHSQPNELEINNSLKDFKIKNKQTRLIPGEFSIDSLNIYKEWFQKLNCQNRLIYRLIEKPNNTLGSIKDTSISDFITIVSNLPEDNNNFTFEDQKFNFNKDSFKSYINQKLNSACWNKQLFPLDYVSLSHDKSNQELISKIEGRQAELYAKIRKILND